MTKKFNDPIVEAFAVVYGVLNLLQDVGVRKVRASRRPNYIGCCPFHNDSTESFSINVQTGMFKCFACGIQGSLYKFVELSYNLDYQQARDFIASRAGFDENVNIDDITFLRDIYNLTADDADTEKVNWDEVFENARVASERMYQGPDPYNYLQGRGFSEETIKYFECGYTEDYLGRGYGGQKRITIPGHDEYGQLCGFIGRTPINANPKYLYTSGYPKSYTLFNLHRAKEFSDRGIIVVEGSLDVVKLHELGYPNAVAILGASLSETQMKLLLKYTDKVYLMFDNDQVGGNANLEGLKALKDLLDVYYVPLRKFKDPGEVPDKETLDALFARSKSWFKFELEKGGVQRGKDDQARYTKRKYASW